MNDEREGTLGATPVGTVVLVPDGHGDEPALLVDRTAAAAWVIPLKEQRGEIRTAKGETKEVTRHSKRQLMAPATLVKPVGELTEPQQRFLTTLRKRQEKENEERKTGKTV